MTMPHERTRSLIEAEKMLVELRKDPALSDKMRDRISGILRHYPSESEILYQGRYDFISRMKGHSLDITQPFLSPSSTFEGEKAFIEKHKK
jgi:hypothetical protein